MIADRGYTMTFVFTVYKYIYISYRVRTKQKSHSLCIDLALEFRAKLALDTVNAIDPLSKGLVSPCSGLRS